LVRIGVDDVERRVYPHSRTLNASFAEKFGDGMELDGRHAKAAGI